jgi:2-polyprenyl-3-methyl-5-hydroxy-6-metoxy-1,4-benzoquinol methylase
MSVLKNFVDLIEKSIEAGDFVKMTLSKPHEKETELKTVYGRLIDLKKTQNLSFTFSYQTKDLTKNYDITSGLLEIHQLVAAKFKNATLITSEWNYQLMTSKKGKMSLLRLKNTETATISTSHDREKKKLVSGDENYLKLLGVADQNGNVIPKMADKFKQINKYLEILEGMIVSTKLPKNIDIVDMGCGKGYLTFALYDFMTNKLGMQVKIVGVEVREDLVDTCNAIALKCGYENLKFQKNSIESFEQDKIDILIALHACDTATDDALYSGIKSKASLIVSAPCCHKQIRKQVKGKEQNSPLMKYGIFKERQFEMVTDTIRALILEKNQYQSNIFEFVSNEHTRKNILLVGAKSTKTPNVEHIDTKIEAIKSEFQIDKHYLEELIN